MKREKTTKREILIDKGRERGKEVGVNYVVPGRSDALKKIGNTETGRRER